MGIEHYWNQCKDYYRRQVIWHKVNNQPFLNLALAEAACASPTEA